MRRVAGILISTLALFVSVSVSAQTSRDDPFADSNLRELLKAASEDGWIEFVPQAETKKADQPPQARALTDFNVQCDLFQGIDPDGLFAENPVKDRALNRLLPKLLEGLPLTDEELDRFEGISQCGPEFESWAHLAMAQRDPSRIGTEDAIGALYSHSPYIRERAGLTLGIFAGLAGDRVTLRRIADMLEDGGLHGTVGRERDPRHILLDALLYEATDFETSLQKYRWLSEHDGAEQVIALRRLTDLGAENFAAGSLERLGKDKVLKGSLQVSELKLNAVLKSGSLVSLSAFTSSEFFRPSEIPTDVYAEITSNLKAAFSGSDLSEKILALDILTKLEPLNEDEILKSMAAETLDDILGKSSERAPTVEQAVVSLSEIGRPATPESVTSDTMRNFISDISQDLSAAEKILSDG